jgi:hypothetical protein
MSDEIQEGKLLKVMSIEGEQPQYLVVHFPWYVRLGMVIQLLFLGKIKLPR